MNAVDILVILLLGGGAVVGFVRGFTHELLALIAWIVGIAAVKLFHAPLQLRLEPSVGTDAGASALAERPVADGTVVMGEVALSGEVRPLAHAALRLKEAAKLGFEAGWVPAGTDGPDGMRLAGFARLSQLVDQILGR